MGFGEWGTVLAWGTKRIDQVANYFKKKGRKNEIKQINRAVDSGDDSYVADKLRKIKDEADSRG